MDADADEAQAALDARLETFLARLTPSLGRPKQRRHARTCVAGLLLDGERKSVQPLAGRPGATDKRRMQRKRDRQPPFAAAPC